MFSLLSTKKVYLHNHRLLLRPHPYLKLLGLSRLTTEFHIVLVLVLIFSLLLVLRNYVLFYLLVHLHYLEIRLSNISKGVMILVLIVLLY